jgi:hypothetical protein
MPSNLSLYSLDKVSNPSLNFMSNFKNSVSSISPKGALKYPAHFLYSFVVNLDCGSYDAHRNSWVDLNTNIAKKRRLILSRLITIISSYKGNTSVLPKRVSIPPANLLYPSVLWFKRLPRVYPRGWLGGLNTNVII